MPPYPRFKLAAGGCRCEEMGENVSRQDRGATLVEYAMLMSLVVLVAFLAVAAFGGSVLGLFQRTIDAIL